MSVISISSDLKETRRSAAERLDILSRLTLDCSVSTSWWTSCVRPAGWDNEFRSQREAEQPPVISWGQFNSGRHVYLLLQTLRIKSWMFDKIQIQQQVNNSVNVIDEMWTRHKLLSGTSQHVGYCFIYFFLSIFLYKFPLTSCCRFTDVRRLPTTRFN